MSETNEDAVGFTARNYAKVLRCLLAPDGYDRLAADGLLHSLLMGAKRDELGRWVGLFDDALAFLGPDVDAFLAAVISDTAIRSDLEFRQRMRGFKQEIPGADWRVPALVNYPLEGPAEYPIAAMAFGVPTWMRGLGPVAQGRTSQLIECLAHPEPLIVDAAFECLGSIGPVATAAIDPMIDLMMQKGSRFGPFDAPRCVVRVAGDSSAVATRLIGRLLPQSSDTAVEAICSVLLCLSAVDESVIHRLFALAQNHASHRARFWLAWTGTRSARRSGIDASAWLGLAQEFAQSSESELRSAAAQMLSGEDEAEFGRDIVLELGRDTDADVRASAHRAAATWRDPPAAAVDNAASDLGNYDSYDGEPTASAVTALTAWGEWGAQSIDRIVTWADSRTAELESGAENNDVVRYIGDIADALGKHAALLQPGIAAIAAYYESGDEVDEDAGSSSDDADAGEEGYDQSTTVDGDSDFAIELDPLLLQFPEMASMQAEFDAEWQQAKQTGERADPVALAKRLGLPSEGDIPGTESSSWEDDQPGPRLRRLLKRLPG